VVQACDAVQSVGESAKKRADGLSETADGFRTLDSRLGPMIARLRRAGFSHSADRVHAVVIRAGRLPLLLWPPVRVTVAASSNCSIVASTTSCGVPGAGLRYCGE
jgi:hypothetical protein